MPAPSSVAANVLTDPGYLWMAPLGTAEPTPTVAGSKFTDVIPAAWLPLGATTEGSTFSYSTTVEAIRVAEYFDPIKYSTTERNGSIAFNLANWTLSNYKRALNGGVSRPSPRPARPARSSPASSRRPRVLRRGPCCCGSRPTPPCACCAVR
jgi:hypothetical protein